MNSDQQNTVGLAGTPGQGPRMIIALSLSGETIAEAGYSTYGCPAAQACGQWICEAVERKSIRDAVVISEEDLLKGVGRMPLGRMPLGREHCAGLAVGALRDAIGKIGEPAHCQGLSKGRERLQRPKRRVHQCLLLR